MDMWIKVLYDMSANMILPTTAAFAIAAIGLNVHFGFTGLLNMGQAGFMLIGAYGFAIATIAGFPFWAATLVTIGCGTLFALLLGIPTLKLRGDYLAIVTIAAAEIVRMVGRASVLNDITGGSNGLAGEQFRNTFSELSPMPDGQTTILWFTFDNTGVNGWFIRIVAWSLVVIFAVLVWLLMRSPWGRVIKGIREDEDAVRSLGKNVFAFKMQSLIIGGVLGAIGGMFYVLPTSVQPDALGRNMTFLIWTAMLLGGAATIWGPVLGSILFFALRIFIQGTVDILVPDAILNTQQTEQFSWIMVGVALMLLVIFRPQGILGDKKELNFNV
ncbi:MAG: branched-chain amino acid ABC transporter permease [Aurantimicrobium sp.]|uniref:branched-chain amino acid ABC transporter permease n=1 Tax=Aurantimicrobium sp. TaxID=1930784 RepID=UPI002FCB4A6C